MPDMQFEVFEENNYPSNEFEHSPVLVEEEILPTDEKIEAKEEETPPALVPGSDTIFVEEETQPDEQKAEDAVKKETDWANDGDHSKFVNYLKDKLTKIPRHSGTKTIGCERACAYLKSLKDEISKAMRSDLDGKIDEVQVDQLQKDIQHMIDRLEQQIERLSKKAGAFSVNLFSDGECNKCGVATPIYHDISNDRLVCMHCEAHLLERDGALKKEAGTPRLNVFMSAFERAFVGILINATVSGGKNIEDTYNKLKGKYNLSDREELAIQSLLADHGFHFYKDRGLLNEPSNSSDGSGIEFQTNYYA